jgi:hypothetical protein
LIQKEKVERGITRMKLEVAAQTPTREDVWDGG